MRVSDGGADFLIRKSTKTAATTAALFDSQYAPNRLSAETPLGSLQRSPRLLSCISGAYFKGRGDGSEGRLCVLCPGEKRSRRLFTNWAPSTFGLAAAQLAPVDIAVNQPFTHALTQVSLAACMASLRVLSNSVTYILRATQPRHRQPTCLGQWRLCLSLRPQSPTSV